MAGVCRENHSWIIQGEQAMGSFGRHRPDDYGKTGMKFILKELPDGTGLIVTWYGWRLHTGPLTPETDVPVVPASRNRHGDARDFFNRVHVFWWRQYVILRRLQTGPGPHGCLARSEFILRWFD